MGNYQNDELRRLEEALLEEEDFAADFPQRASQTKAAPVCKAVNTDRADVDMEKYSEDIHRGKSRGILGDVLTMAGMLLLSAGVLLLLKFLGVL